MYQEKDRTMNYNDINSYIYFTKPYAYGWMVYHIEGTEQIMDMCFSRPEDALSYAASLNLREAKRVEDVKARLENARNSVSLNNGIYYSITGYYGD